MVVDHVRVEELPLVIEAGEAVRVQVGAEDAKTPAGVMKPEAKAIPIPIATVPAMAPKPIRTGLARICEKMPLFA